MNQTTSSVDSMSMDTSASTIESQVEPNDILTINNTSKRKDNNKHELSKRSKLIDMVFYDGNRHPAAVLHELRPEISPDKYIFELEESTSKQPKFRCSVTIDQNLPEPIVSIGIGRSKQLAKNMAAQQTLMKLFPTYRPPEGEILTEDFDMHQQSRFISTRPPSLQNDPTTLIESIRKHLTVKSIAIKTPLQLFNELFINNQRLNSSTLKKNCIELISNEENLVLVRVTALDQQFWSVSAAKTVAQNDACQKAIETLCNVSFREAKDEFIRALHSMNKITLPSEINIDINNNSGGGGGDRIVEQQRITSELSSLPGVSSSFLQPTEEV